MPLDEAAPTASAVPPEPGGVGVIVGVLPEFTPILMACDGMVVFLPFTVMWPCETIWRAARRVGAMPRR